MRAKQAEHLLAILYIGSMILSLISVIALVTTWQHWAWTLDSCIGFDCGCPLYGTQTFTTFLGGDVKLCYFGSYGLIPSIIIGLCLGIYHGYRCCIHKDLDDPKRVGEVYSDDRRNLNGQAVVVNVRKRSACKQWMLASFLATLICCISLIHAAIITDGYYKTCGQYKRNLVKILGSRGLELQVIHNRLPCGAIFDFMDYLQPDANNWRRGSEINTGIALQLAIFASWFNFFAWIVVCWINLIMARKRRHTQGKKCCCCC